MYTRHDDIPVLSAWPDKVAAAHYNIVHRALSRLSPSIRLALPGLKTLDLILQKDAWIVVDRAFNDVPVLAWARFEADADRGLHEAVPCELRYFHGHAGMILKQVLGLIDELLTEKLRDGDPSHEVIAFPEKKA